MIKIILTLIFTLIFSQISAAQNGSVVNQQAYKLLLEADALKNKNKNCAAAIEVYEKSLALNDFKQPSVYQSLAGCYAQINDRRRAFFFLDKMISIGWLNDEEILKDETLKTLLADSRGKK